MENKSLYSSQTYLKDLKCVLDNNPVIKELSNKTIFITGATGLICSSIIDLLLMSNSEYKTNISIIAAAHNEKKALDRFNDFPSKKALSFLNIIPYDATTKNNFGFKTDYIIHGASNAHPKEISEKPVETMLANFCGLQELLKYAKENNVTNTLFISSSEVYGQKENDSPFNENEYGYVDILNPRNSYAISKRAAETLCASYTKEYGVKTSIVRPGHIYGPTASETDSRVGSSLAYDVINGKDIVLKSSGSQIRSYCYVLDCDSAILTVLLKGESANAYNISNPDSIITIRELAELYAKEGNVQVKFDLPSEKEKSRFNPMNNSSLDSKKLEALGWEGLFNAKDGINKTVQILKANN